jgi:hypothetical protein
MIRFVVPRVQQFGIMDYIASRSGSLDQLAGVLHYEDLPECLSFPSGTYVFLALDQLTPGGIRMVIELQDRLCAAGLPVLNDPRRTLLRYDLLAALHREGINRHGVVRAAGDRKRLRYPVFLREEHRHNGSLTPLLVSPAAVDAAVGRAVLKGHRLEDLLLVEYCDTRDANGLYRKYSAFRVGPAVFVRGMGWGHDWMLKASGFEFSEAMLREERSYAEANPWGDQLRRVFELGGTDFGRIDFAVVDGRVEAWEINLNPTIGPTSRTMKEDWVTVLRQPARDLFHQRFKAALEAIDTPDTGAPLPINLGAVTRRDAVPVVRPDAREGLLVRLARAARPLKPLLDGAARLAAPVVARVARWLR